MNSEIDAVRKWLLEQGYPLEMRVAKKFAENDFGILQGEFFEDPNENKLRETDVIAQRLFLSPKETVELQLQFVVECKTTKGKQWLLFAHQYSAIRAPNFLKLTTETQNLFSNLDLIPELKLGGILRGSFDAGYALTVANKNNNDDLAYRGLSSVIAAANSWKSQPLGMLGSLSAAKLCIRIPCLVINENMYKVSLNKKNEPHLRKVSYGYLDPKSGTNRKGIDVFVLMEGALDKFVKAVLSEVNLLLNACDKRTQLFQENSITGKEAITSLFARKQAIGET